jgi:hypothetical protein
MVHERRGSHGRALRHRGVAKARGETLSVRFVAVTCHYDIAEWLEPDWVTDMATGTCQRRRLRRPRLHVEVHRAGREAWRMFSRHHYLTGSLAPGARCAKISRSPFAYLAP